MPSISWFLECAPAEIEKITIGHQVPEVNKDGLLMNNNGTVKEATWKTLREVEEPFTDPTDAVLYWQYLRLKELVYFPIFNFCDNENLTAPHNKRTFLVSIRLSPDDWHNVFEKLINY